MFCPLLSLFVESRIAKIEIKIELYIYRSVAVRDDDDHWGVVGCYVGPVTKVNCVTLVFVPKASAESVHLHPDIWFFCFLNSEGLIKRVFTHDDIVLACRGRREIEGGWSQIVYAGALRFVVAILHVPLTFYLCVSLLQHHLGLSLISQCVTALYAQFHTLGLTGSNWSHTV